MNEQISAVIRENRKKKNLTQVGLAELLHVSPQAVSKWERGECLPDVALLPALATVFEIPIQTLFNESANDYQAVITQIKEIVNETYFDQLLDQLKNSSHIGEMEFPNEILFFLSNEQKAALFRQLFQMDDWYILFDDLFQYAGPAQKRQAVQILLELQQYRFLELFIPYMPKQLRSEVLQSLLEKRAFEYIEEMLPFLNREQKEAIVCFAQENRINPDSIGGLYPFLDEKLRNQWEKLF